VGYTTNKPPLANTLRCASPTSRSTSVSLKTKSIGLLFGRHLHFVFAVILVALMQIVTGAVANTELPKTVLNVRGSRASDTLLGAALHSAIFKSFRFPKTASAHTEHPEIDARVILR
jgi:hypothetical protein